MTKAVIDTMKELTDYLAAQCWRRTSESPCIQIGEPGAFDDTHVFCPAVIFEEGRYRLYYCGSTGVPADDADRIYSMGLAESDDGVTFTRRDGLPVYSMPDGASSVVTPTFLRNPDGTLLRENGRLRMWHCGVDFSVPGTPHFLHETASDDGLTWDAPSPALLDNIYAPTIIKEDGLYKMWFTDVTTGDGPNGYRPWDIRYATSPDGKAWEVRPTPVLQVDQAWEHINLFYPFVLKVGGVYCMWYGSYWEPDTSKTAMGFAASTDGITWVKSQANPVFTPVEGRYWETNYTTSETVLPLPDGRWRIWYASRCNKVQEHKYFAISTAELAAFPPD